MHLGNRNHDGLRLVFIEALSIGTRFCAHGQLVGRMGTASASRNPSQRDLFQPLLVKYLHPLGRGSDDTLGAEGTEFAIDNLARGAGCVGESLLSDVRNRESIMGGKSDRAEVEGDTRCRR
jgi:hypothetical protein